MPLDVALITPTLPSHIPKYRCLGACIMASMKPNYLSLGIRRFAAHARHYVPLMTSNEHVSSIQECMHTMP